MLKTIIIDDEQDAIDILLDELTSHCPNIEVVDTSCSGIEGLKSIRKYQPDAIFLDIDMPDMSGFEMLELVGDIDFGIIFTTAFNEYAVQAIRISPVDYLLKPISETKLIEAVDSLKKYQIKKDYQEQYKILRYNMNIQNSDKKITFSTQDSYDFINSKDIIYCEASGGYTNVHLAEAEKRTYVELLKSVEKRIEGCNFFRIHHKYLVNIYHIKKYIKHNNTVNLTNDITLPVARQRKNDLLERILQSPFKK